MYLDDREPPKHPQRALPGYAIVAPSILEFGNDEQKQLVAAAIRGDTIWCIGMSEPNAGSDLIAVTAMCRSPVLPSRYCGIVASHVTSTRALLRAEE